MFRQLFVLSMLALGLSSCGFWFYNYRARLDTQFFLPNTNKDTAIRYAACKTIYRLAQKSEIYSSYTGPRCDTLYFYGPDYHKLRFKLYENDSATVVRFLYSGFNGWRGRPPHRQFIMALRDSLRLRFGATEFIKVNVSNEKTKHRKR